MRTRPHWQECVGEVVGTFILALFGLGSVHAAVLTGAQSGLLAVAIVWGLGIALAIYCVGAISGAHLNPSITIALAVFRKFPARKIGPYILSQLLGAFLAAALLYVLFSGPISRFEKSHNLVRGQPGSEQSAMIYGEYFPNPGIKELGPMADSAVTWPVAMLAEGVGTAMLAFFVFALTDRHNPGRPNGTLFALLIGLAVSIIVSFVAPLTQSGLNPARDFGPRLFSCFAGWGQIAIPGPEGNRWGFLTVYILAPVIGALVGSAGYEFLVHRAMIRSADESKAEQQGES